MHAADALPVDQDDAWASWAAQWILPDGVTYLNHGSFGLSPLVVREAAHRWLDTQQRQPMEMFYRLREPALRASLTELARFVGTSAENLVPVENATVAMNCVANSFPLASGDEVLLTDHEYGAVRRIWDRACRQQGATRKEVVLPFPPESDEQVVDTVIHAITERTRIVVISHVTSPSALILPLEQLSAALTERDVAICIDGPHAPAHIPLDIDRLGCDFYTASCHKWLCAPFGSGFLYVDPKHQDSIQPTNLSWGRLPPRQIESWQDEFLWAGTRDYSAYLTIPAAIEFMQQVGLEAFRGRTHYLLKMASDWIADVTRMASPLDGDQWHGSMGLAELPPGETWSLNKELQQQYGIEIPVVEIQGRRFLRISAHLYNGTPDFQKLAQAIDRLVMQ